MRAIKLHFTNKIYLDKLLVDNDFNQEINYLNPKKTTEVDLILFDPIPQHNYLDTEIVILSIFSRAVKKHFFANTEFNIEFLSPFVNTQKGGLHHNGLRIIDTTDIQFAEIVITVFK